MLQLPYQSLTQLPASHEIRLLFRQIIFLAAESADRRQTPLHMSQKIVQLMYKTPSQLGREIYVAILDQLCHAFEEVAKEAISWLIYSDDEVSCRLGNLNAVDLSSAEIRRCCHRHIAQEWIDYRSATGSATREIHVRTLTVELAHVHREPHSRVPHI